MTINPLLLETERHGYAVLTLNRPEKRNPLSEDMIAALMNAFTRIETRKDIRAVILAAKGSVFSAGHDLKEMSAHRQDPDRGRAYFEDILLRCATMMQKIMTLPQPVIAAVEELPQPRAVSSLPVAILRLSAKKRALQHLAFISDFSVQRRWLPSRVPSQENTQWKCSCSVIPCARKTLYA